MFFSITLPKMYNSSSPLKSTYIFNSKTNLIHNKELFTSIRALISITTCMNIQRRPLNLIAFSCCVNTCTKYILKIISFVIAYLDNLYKHMQVYLLIRHRSRSVALVVIDYRPAALPYFCPL